MQGGRFSYQALACSGPSEYLRAMDAIDPPQQSARPLLPHATTVFVTHGVVESGDRRGRTIGFPTANVPFESNDRFDGVWAGWVDIDGERHLAAVSIGHRPTFYGSDGFRLLEAHLIDFGGDLYGRTITVTLWQLIRNQVRFESVDQLVDQLRRDVATCRRLARSRTDRSCVPSEPDPSLAGVARAIRLAS